MLLATNHFNLVLLTLISPFSAEQLGPLVLLLQKKIPSAVLATSFVCSELLNYVKRLFL